METIYFKGEPCHTYGSLPKVGEKAPCFTLVTPELKEVHCTDFKGRKVVLNIFPSLDTPVCATSVRRFNQEAASLENTAVLCVSMDLPFAAGRFCSAEGITDVTAASAFRSPSFIEQYGVGIVDGPLAGLLARAVIVIDEDQNVVYADLVNEITNEPNYAEALDVLRR
ncbi:thiol peroxidase [Paramuribaculum intestinale]|uniref:thiol peroxidase n=1 Tax=Paramuribaculum intestinale TaxID=2094151 RepID=UPI00262777E9|nr:thiol peroxidase [Paramuribaculum intestinale]